MVVLKPTKDADMTRLNGKTAVITGGATGIGRAAAKRFIEGGAFVFIFGRRQKELDAAVADLGPNARAVKGSVSDEADLDRLYAAVKAERGTLDIVFANAGVGSQLALGEITAKHIGRSGGDRSGGRLSRVVGQQLHDRQRGRRGRRPCATLNRHGGKPNGKIS
jgi:NAD(P)-dependent dehydrogenase (short-subunit alcohol dehydrogenase family)